MNFFRLRLLNTLLLFAVGVFFGFILKEKFFPSENKPESRYQPVYDYQSRPAAKKEDEEEPLTDEPYLAEGAVRTAPAAEAERAAPAAVIEAAPAKPAAAEPPRNIAADFFAKPAAFEGKDVELDLQMISARKAGAGWRLNLVHAPAAGKPEYLYVEDQGSLGEKPDLKVGFVYRVRFNCSRGLADAGNAMSYLAPTGAKADWATGVSAVE